jgi:hypothetical protein
MNAEFLHKLALFFHEAGLARVHADAVENTARAAVAALAGVPHYEQLWAGDLGESVQIVAVGSAEHVPGVEFARRAQLLRERALAMSERVGGEVQVLQLALYDRTVSSQESGFVVDNARVRPWFPLARGQVATWVVSIPDRQVYAARFRGWPADLSADQLRALIS